MIANGQGPGELGSYVVKRPAVDIPPYPQRVALENESGQTCCWFKLQ